LNSIDNYFVGAFAQTIKSNSSSPDIPQFANHLLPNKLHSKQWLVEQLAKHVTPDNVLLLGSWYPTYIPYYLGGNHFTCVDTDPTVRHLAEQFNIIMYGDNDKFRFTSTDAKLWLEHSHEQYDVVINTSCEHMEFDLAEMNLNNKSMYAMQSNNYTHADGIRITEHINCKSTLDEFVNSCGLSRLYYTGELKLQQYTRFMVIGQK